LVVARANDERDVRARHGLMRALVANMVTGVTKAMKRVLKLLVSVIVRKKPAIKWY